MGQTTKIIAIPGVPETRHEWQPIVRAGADRGESIGIKLSMSYLASRHAEPFTKILGRGARDLAAAIDADLSKGGEATVICGDMGAVLFSLAYRHIQAKDQISRLVFYNSSLGKVSFRHCYHMPLLSIPFAPRLVWSQAGAYRALTDRPWDPAIAAELDSLPGLALGLSKAYQALSLFQVKQGLTAKKAKPFPLAPTTAVTVIWGVHDRFFRREQLEHLQILFPQAQIIRRDGGHFNHLDDPKRFVNDVLEQS